MFHWLGTAVTKGWSILLVGWLLLLGYGTLVAPAWDEVAESGQFSFLPSDEPGNRGKELLKRAFPEQSPTSTIVLVLSRDEPQGLREEDKIFLAHVLKPGLQQIATEFNSTKGQGANSQPLVNRIRSGADKGEGALLRSADNKAAIALLELSSEFLSRRDWPLIERVEQLLHRLRQEQKTPPGLAIHLTGSSIVGRDIRQAEMHSADSIGRWTVIVVIGLLLLIYRAPLLALLPLATVFIATQCSLRLLATLAQHRFVDVSDTLRIYITVLSYGAGVDYCLFLIARYREELERGGPVKDAVASAIGKTGGALAASAGTVICGIGTLAFAQFGKYHQAGICIPLSLVVVLAAALTFSPALLCLVGRWAFWPTRQIAPAQTEGMAARLWERLANALVARPAMIWLACVAALAPLIVVAVLHYGQVDYGISSELPESTESAEGLQVLKEHFPAGLVAPATVLIANNEIYFGTIESYGLIGAISDGLARQQDSLQLADIRSLAHAFGVTRRGQETITSITVATPPASGEALSHLSFVHYVSNANELTGHVTRLELVSQLDPLSQESIRNVTRLENAVRDALPSALANSQLEIAGASASLRDLEEVTQHDLRRMEIMVPSVVFVILLILLRRIIVSLYLIASVVASFLATLGVTFLVFRFLDPEHFIGLDWKVPVFLLTILVAVGEDYKIFLMTRVREEEREHGPVNGVTAALVRTGGVITSCGLIMAGTFAALLTGSLIETKQMGFALAFGVLLDTLLVRPVLVPAFLIWMRRVLVASGAGLHL